MSDPINQGSFEPDIMSRLFGFDPFMFENLLLFSLKFPVEVCAPQNRVCVAT